MKNILSTALKILLILTLLLVFGLLLTGLTIWMQWPKWITLFIVLGIVGIWFAGLFIRRFFLRRREQHFVHQVIEQDEARMRGLSTTEQQGEKELQARWKEAIDALKSSHLNKLGNPLYVLPWYMIIGESGAGKTTAIQSARLSSPFTEVHKTAGISGTRNCDWWFSENAIIIDTAGRYTFQENQDSDKREWQKFLSLLVKYRKKEPLNGLVVALSAENLLNYSREGMEQYGLTVRQRVDELMRVLGAKFPVYILITKCDLVQGMTQFCDRLPEKSLDQAMGVLNQKISSDVNSIEQQLQTGIIDKLKELRLLLFHKPKNTFGISQKTDTALLLFPEEFQGMNTNLDIFLQNAFKENPYQESPILRGIFFSSGRQEGTPYSHFLSSLGLIEQRDILPGTNRGLFLHDLFTRILPQDKELFAPTQRRLAWSRLTRNLGLTAWITIILALCGLLSFSFVKNLTTLRGAAAEFNKQTTLQGEILTDTVSMENFLQSVLKVETFNRSWWIPRLGLNESKKIEIELKKKYCRQFHNNFSAEFDKRLERRIGSFNSSTTDQMYGRHIAHLTKRINLIQARLDGQDLHSLPDNTKPSYQPVLAAADSLLVEEISNRIAILNLYYLQWQTDTTLLDQENKELQAMLQHLLTIPDTNLNWLVSWINNDSGLPYITLKDFWSNQLTRDDIASVPPAFTVEGKNAIENLIVDIEKSLFDPLLIAERKIKFSQWYQRAYIQIWNDFGTNFPKAEYYLKDKNSWQQAAVAMASDNGAYLHVLAKMADELKPFKGKDSMPAWLKLVHELQTVRNEAHGEQAMQEGNVLANVAKKGKKVIGSLEKKIGANENVNFLEKQLLAAKSYLQYQKALSEITLVSSSRKVSYKMAVDIFNEDPATSETPVYLAQKALIQLRNELDIPGDDQKMFWRLMAGPLTFFRDYICLEAACHINTLWEQEVLVEIQGINDKTQMNSLLFENNGYVQNFIKGSAAPFLNRNLEKGFFPKSSLGRMLPFKESFLTFLTKGIKLTKFKPDFELDDEIPLELQLEAGSIFEMESKQKKQDYPLYQPNLLKSNYKVIVVANPTSVNQGAQISPHATRLELICKDKTTNIINLNYPIRKEFTWQPEKCSEVNLEIEVGSIVLKKKYEGELSFPLFLNDFTSGSHIYSAQDFPEKQKELDRMKIKFIKVTFHLDGAKPLIAIIEEEENRKKAEKAAEEARAKQAAQESQNMKAMLATWEKKQKMEALENEAMKRAWKLEQEKKAEALKRAWEAKLPDVPYSILTCWDE